MSELKVYRSCFHVIIIIYDDDDFFFLVLLFLLFKIQLISLSYSPSLCPTNDDFHNFCICV